MLAAPAAGLETLKINNSFFRAVATAVLGRRLYRGGMEMVSCNCVVLVSTARGQDNDKLTRYSSSAVSETRVRGCNECGRSNA